jgi:hypothetical protein
MALLLPVSFAQAQTGGGYDLTWWTVDGGGGTLQGGGYTLMGTAGQPDPAPALTGGDYTLVGGFWPGASSPHVFVYLPLVLRQGP